MREDEVVDLLLEVADAPPKSRAATDQLEASLWDASTVVGVEDFLCVLAMYEPTDTPREYLIGFDGLRSAAQEALHDLGRHDRCIHDAPLADRP
jgi:hypothetical protein